MRFSPCPQIRIQNAPLHSQGKNFELTVQLPSESLIVNDDKSGLV